MPGRPIYPISSVSMTLTKSPLNFSVAQPNFLRNITALSRNKILSYVWPITKLESPKFLFITLLMFCILGIQNLIRALKDGIINTMIGTEAISFLKLLGVTPAALLITIIYIKLVNYLKSEHIFYLTMAIFLSFFGLFAFYIFPNYQTLHLAVDNADQLIQTYPNFKWFILLRSNWSFSLFYIIAELWPNVMFALLFWQFVNSITTVDESKRFYPLFGLLGQTGLCIFGQLLTKLSSVSQYLMTTFNLQLSEDAISIQVILTVVIGLGLVALYAFWRINHQVLDATTRDKIHFQVTKQHLSLLESLKMVVSSRYIMLIATLLVCYGMAINLVEGPWKNAAAKIYPTTTEFVSFVGQYLSYTGIFTILFTLLGTNIVRRLGWFSAAVITPIMVFVSGILFYLVININIISMLMIPVLAFTDPVSVAITIGAIQNVLSKSSKYTLFDSTKEMAYVPLSDELKTKGKAAADMIGIKLGKSASALVQSLIFIVIPTATFQSISIYLMVVFTIVCGVWIWGVKELAGKYQDITIVSQKLS